MPRTVIFDPAIHRRRSIRLKGYDYSERGLYFVTICVHRQECLFGHVRDAVVSLNEAGLAVQAAGFDLGRRFADVELDAYIVMPNHFHGILSLVGAGLAPPNVPAALEKKGTASRAPTIRRVTLGDVVGTFKSTSGIRVNRILGRKGKPLWQRNYYEHIIRHGHDLEEVRSYVRENPARWNDDPENPDRSVGNT